MKVMIKERKKLECNDKKRIKSQRMIIERKKRVNGLLLLEEDKIIIRYISKN